MQKITEHDAMNLITAGLTSGSIQLIGCANATSDEAAKTRGTRDAIYLATLLKGLAEAE